MTPTRKEIEKAAEEYRLREPIASRMLQKEDLADFAISQWMSEERLYKKLIVF